MHALTPPGLVPSQRKGTARGHTRQRPRRRQPQSAVQTQGTASTAWQTPHRNPAGTRHTRAQTPWGTWTLAGRVLLWRQMRAQRRRSRQRQNTRWTQRVVAVVIVLKGAGRRGRRMEGAAPKQISHNASDNSKQHNAEKDRDRQTDRERHTEREGDRQTDTDRQREREKRTPTRTHAYKREPSNVLTLC